MTLMLCARDLPLIPRNRPLPPRQGAFRPSCAYISNSAAVDESPE